MVMCVPLKAGWLSDDTWASVSKLCRVPKIKPSADKYLNAEQLLFVFNRQSGEKLTVYLSLERGKTSIQSAVAGEFTQYSVIR